MSAKTGTVLASTTAEAVEKNVYGGTMTSSSARQAGRHQREPQRDGAVDDRDAVLAAVHGGEALLELGDFLSVEPAPLAAAQRARAGGLPRPCRRWARR